MNLSQTFNAAASGNLPTFAAPTSADGLGRQLLDLVSRPMDGHAKNLNITEQAQELIRNGADLNMRDSAQARTPLIWATVYCRAKILGAILAQDPDLNARGTDGMTALDHAKKNKNRLALQLLEKAQARQREQLMQELHDMRSRRDFSALKPAKVRKRGRNGQGQPS